MARFHDWEERLNAYLTEVQHTTFEMGVFDCCTFVAGAIEAMTGQDYMIEFRGSYDDWDSSDKALEEIGQGTLYQTLLEKFGEPTFGAKGHKGDIAYFQDSIGVILGRYAIFVGEKGLVYARLSQLDYVFKVPY